MCCLLLFGFCCMVNLGLFGVIVRLFIVSGLDAVLLCCLGGYLFVDLIFVALMLCLVFKLLCCSFDLRFGVCLFGYYCKLCVVG